MKNKILVLVAHSDDETLGIGGTIAKHISIGDEVIVVVMTDNYRSPHIDEDFKKAMAILGVNDYALFNYPDMQLAKYTVWELSSQLEKYITKNGVPDLVYTHSENDLSQDHKITHDIAMTVFRPLWDKPISICSFDVPSSSEWSSKLFQPNLFVDITNYIDKKIQAFDCYKTEIREFPHSRSEQALRSRAMYWGSYCGVDYAEALRVIRMVK